MQAIVEASGLLLSSGILLATSSYLYSSQDQNESSCVANATEATEMLNKALGEVQSNALLLTPQLGPQVYEKLIHSLAKIGIRSEYSAQHFGLDVDLSHLLLPNLSFSAERKLFADLAKVGLLLAPGEAHGWEIPGHFILCSARCDDTAFHEELVTRFQALIAARDPHSAAARALRNDGNAASASVAAAPAQASSLAPSSSSATSTSSSLSVENESTETSQSTAERRRSDVVVEETPAKRTRRQQA